MIEIVGFGSPHAKSLHDATGPMICGDGGCDDFRQFQSLETVGQSHAGGFRRITSAPMCRSKSPADFNRGGESCFVSYMGQANEADEWTHVRDLDRPEPEIVRNEMISNPLRQGIACPAAIDRQQMLDHGGVG
jgi:hypothetical protein